MSDVVQNNLCQPQNIPGLDRLEFYVGEDIWIQALCMSSKAI